MRVLSYVVPAEDDGRLIRRVAAGGWAFPAISWRARRRWARCVWTAKACMPTMPCAPDRWSR